MEKENYILVADNSIYDRLYEAIKDLEKPAPDCIVLHPNAILVKLFMYERKGYPLGKNIRGFKKWRKRNFRSRKNSICK